MSEIVETRSVKNGTVGLRIGFGRCKRQASCQERRDRHSLACEAADYGYQFRTFSRFPEMTDNGLLESRLYRHCLKFFRLFQGRRRRVLFCRASTTQFFRRYCRIPRRTLRRAEPRSQYRLPD